MVGLEQRTELNGLEGVLEAWDEGTGRWALRVQGFRHPIKVIPTRLQALEGAPPKPPTFDYEDVAKEVRREWAGKVRKETQAITQTLLQHGAGMASVLRPTKPPTPQITEAYRNARRNFRNVDELREALNGMEKGKTGRTLAVEHLTELPDDMLEPWLMVTDMFFAGETVEELKTGTVTPLIKDLQRFRPITLLEPIYKCCMAVMSTRLLKLFHKHRLLDTAQYGFVLDGHETPASPAQPEAVQ